MAKLLQKLDNIKTLKKGKKLKIRKKGIKKSFKNQKKKKRKGYKKKIFFKKRFKKGVSITCYSVCITIPLSSNP